MNASKIAVLGIMVVFVASAAWADIGFNQGSTEETKISKKDFVVTGVTRLSADRVEASAAVERIAPKGDDVPLGVFVEIECDGDDVLVATLNTAHPNTIACTDFPDICSAGVLDGLDPFLDLCLFGVIEGFAETALGVDLELPNPPVLLNTGEQIATDGAVFNTFRGLLIQP